VTELCFRQALGDAADSKSNPYILPFSTVPVNIDYNKNNKIDKCTLSILFMLELLTSFRLPMESDVTVAVAWCCLVLNTIGGNSKSESESESNADKSVAFI
jgi:hypothetical protein